MNNYIQIYKNVIEPEYCDEIVEKFESNTDQHENYDQGPMSFTQINLNMNGWDADVSKLSQIYVKYMNKIKNFFSQEGNNSEMVSVFL